MYLYCLETYYGDIVLTNDKEYTKCEFDKMCMEVPLGGKYPHRYVSYIRVMEHLINNYGFKYPEYCNTFDACQYKDTIEEDEYID